MELPELLFISTLNHKSHQYIRKIIKNSIYCKLSILKRYFYFKNSTRIINRYKISVIETIYSLAHFYKFRKDIRTCFIPIVTSFPYVLLNIPEWYFRDIRSTYIRIPRFLRMKILINGYYMSKKYAIAYIAVSNLVKNLLRKIDKSKPIIVSYPSMDIENVIEISTIKSIEFNNNIFSYVASGPQKGLDITLEVFKNIIKEEKKIKFYLRISKHMLKLYWKQLKPLIKEQKLILILRRIPWSKIRKFASIYLQTSYIEPFGVAVGEAMYAKMIPIVTETVGAKELFEKEYPNLIAKFDINDISEKILEIINLKESEKQDITEHLSFLALRIHPEKLKREFTEKLNYLLEQISDKL